LGRYFSCTHLTITLRYYQSTNIAVSPLACKKWRPSPLLPLLFPLEAADQLRKRQTHLAQTHLHKFIALSLGWYFCITSSCWCTNDPNSCPDKSGNGSFSSLSCRIEAFALSSTLLPALTNATPNGVRLSLFCYTIHLIGDYCFLHRLSCISGCEPLKRRDRLRRK